jgi:regulator of RNase E activity RraA
VLADDDGIVVAPAAQLEAALERAEAIERAEAAVLAGIRGGADLIGMTNLAEHVARLRAGEASALEITPP